VSWAGTKDKHAVTTQLVGLDKVAPGDLPDIRDAETEAIGRFGRDLQFGDLVGNEFEIRVRGADAPGNAGAVADELGAWHGGSGRAVPNYFGQQRFGSKRPVTHKVGLEIVRGDWEAAAMAYLGNPHENEPADTREARSYVEGTRDWSGALERFPGGLRYERTMLHRLESGGSYREALETFPTGLQSLFVNAAQSYAFNRILSERLARGIPFTEPVAGDVACFAGETVAGLTLPDPERRQEVTERRVPSVAKHCERGRAFVTAPLVGVDTELGAGEPGEIEREVLDELGIGPADFALPGEFYSSGTRRAVSLAVEPEVEREGTDYTLSFSLPKGSYATVVCREFLKASPLAL
jgi:tRNA pseudouridine13 synthase